MTFTPEQDFVKNHKTEEVIAWAVFAFGSAKGNFDSEPDSLARYGRYMAQVDQIYSVLHSLNKKLSASPTVVS